MNGDDLVNFASSAEDRYSYKFGKTGIQQNLNQYNPDKGIGSFLNDISIEGVDEQGRVSLKSIRDSSGSGNGGLKWKKKSELSKPLSNKSRISIKGDNQYEYVLQQDDPFNYGRNSSIMNNNNNAVAAQNYAAGSSQNRLSRKLGVNSEQRISRISSIIQNQINYRQSYLNGGQYEDFIPEEDETDVFDESEEMDTRKMSIRALNINMMSKLLVQSILARASSKILTNSYRNNGRGTISARKTGGQAQNQGNTRKFNDGSVDEESDFLSSHRCSMVKRYNMPTFFSPDKLVSSRTATNQTSPSQDIEINDTIDVHQPNTIGMGNETIVEETGEADESQIMNTRFSQRFRDDEENKDDDEENYDNGDQDTLQNYHGISNVIQDLNNDQQQQLTVMHTKQEEPSKNFIQQKKNKLDAFVTKMPMPTQHNNDNMLPRSESDAPFELNKQSSYQSENQDQPTVVHQDSLNQQPIDEQNADGQDLHKVHFFQTLQALQFIKNGLRVVTLEEIQDQIIYLPDPKRPELKKTVIFDMDETLIHCVDDIETDDPDVILEIDFPDEETVYAGINIRPYVMECLEEANQNFQVIVFTASHQTYADAILDYIDPNRELIQYRMYRQHCILTKEGYYVKDLRVIGNRDMCDMVIVDNSVYSFAFQIDNGIPIIPFYKDPNDEEMLHLIYYLSCLANVEDVRVQNRAAFELYKLANGDSNNGGNGTEQNENEEEQENSGEYQDTGNDNNGREYMMGQQEPIMEMSRESSIQNSRPSASRMSLDDRNDKYLQQENDQNQQQMLFKQESQTDSLYNDEDSAYKQKYDYI